MNWIQVIADIRRDGVTLEQIAQQCGFASRGHVHDLMTGKQGEPKWSIGDKLLAMHIEARRKALRRSRVRKA